VPLIYGARAGIFSIAFFASSAGSFFTYGLFIAMFAFISSKIEKAKKLENKLLPDDIDYLKIEGLRLEARQKLDKIRPLNLGQAGRISGVNPADIAVLMIYLKK
jgi:tRNA U34 5-carboxymethylaminomethyl modifying enzyme MnmG/GidA